MKRIVWLPFSLLLSMAVFAQEKADHLVLTEVYLDKSQPTAAWIEVFNPTDQPLVLERVRISHLKTINVLSDEIKNKGGISVASGEYVVLCADIAQFTSSFGEGVHVVEVKPLKLFGFGGFLAVATKSVEEFAGMVVRYGDASMSSHVQQLAGEYAVPLVTNGKSFSRSVAKVTGGLQISPFAESAPTPGK